MFIRFRISCWKKCFGFRVCRFGLTGSGLRVLSFAWWFYTLPKFSFRKFEACRVYSLGGLHPPTFRQCRPWFSNVTTSGFRLTLSCWGQAPPLATGKEAAHRCQTTFHLLRKVANCRKNIFRLYWALRSIFNLWEAARRSGLELRQRFGLGKDSGGCRCHKARYFGLH